MDFVANMESRARRCGASTLWAGTARKQQITSYLEHWRGPQGAGSNVLDGSKLRLFIRDLLDEAALETWSLLRSGIRNVLSRAFWHRVWIIQEVVLAKEGLVVVGTRSVSLDAFDAALIAIQYCVESRLELMRGEWGSFRGLSANLFQIKSLGMRRLLRQNPAHTDIPLADIFWELGGAPGRPYYTATDPRDILFGLLGLLPEGQACAVRADYRKSVAEVFTTLARILISRGDEDHTSFLLDFCKSGDTSGPLPTWVPDWREIGMYGVSPYRINHRLSFNATRGIFQPTLALHPGAGKEARDDGALRRIGCRVGIVAGVMQPAEWFQETRFDQSWIKNADGWFRFISSFVGLAAVSGPEDDHVWRTITRSVLDHNIHVPRQKREPMSGGTRALCHRIMRLEHVDAENLTHGGVGFVRSGPLFMSFNQGSRPLDNQQVSSFASLW